LHIKVDPNKTQDYYISKFIKISKEMGLNKPDREFFIKPSTKRRDEEIQSKRQIRRKNKARSRG